MNTENTDTDKLKILILTLNFHPEISGIAPHATSFAIEMANRGHSVSVFSALPYYPAWEIHEKCSGVYFCDHNEDCEGKPACDDGLDGVNIYRSWLYIRKNAKITTKVRILAEISFCLFQFINLLRNFRTLLAADKIVIISPFFLQGVTGLVLRYLFGKKYIFHVEDIIPDSALGTGLIDRTNPLIKLFINFVFALEKLVYRKSIFVSTLTQSMKRNITDKLGPGSENKVIIAGYWIDTEKFFRSDNLKARFRKMHGYCPNDVVIGYAGNIGKKQNLEKLIEYATDLAAIDARFKIVIAGDGANRPNIQNAVKANRLENVKMLPLQKGENYLEFLNGVDISYITQTEDANNMFIPSKLYTTMASGSPVICFANKDSELAQIMRDSGGAFLYSWDEKDMFLGDMKKLLVDKNIISVKSDAIYNFANKTFTKEVAVLEFLQAVES